MSAKQFDTPAEIDPVAALQALGEGELQAIDWVVEGQNLRIGHVYRFLSGQRLTAHAAWGDSDVVVKCFYGDRHRVYFEREVQGLESLERAGVDTAACLFSAQHHQGQMHLMVLEYLQDSTTLKQALTDPESSVSLDEWLHQAAELFVRLHQANLTQPDPHLENFLISRGRLHMIDAGQMQVLSAPLKQLDAMDNLALFFAQLPVRLDAAAIKAVHDYWKKSRNEDEVFVEADWANRLLLQRRWRERRFIEKKAFRNCTAYVNEVSDGYFLMLDRKYHESNLTSILSHPEKAFGATTAGFEVTVQHQLIETQGQTFRLTRYPAADFFNRVRWSAAALAWRNGQLLNLLGIPTLRPIGFAERRWGPVRGESYFLMEWEKAQLLSEVLRQDLPESQVIALFRQVIGLLQGLQQAKLVHGHLTAESIMVDGGNCYLAQLENLRHAENSETEQNVFDRNCQQLLEDLDKYGSSAELFRNLSQTEA